MITACYRCARRSGASERGRRCSRARLGLASTKVPYADRAGCLYLAHGSPAFVQGDATWVDALDPSEYAIPLQAVSMILLGPGSTVSHDTLWLFARARTALTAVGEDGVRLYTARPSACMRCVLVRFCRIAISMCSAESGGPNEGDL